MVTILSAVFLRVLMGKREEEQIREDEKDVFFSLAPAGKDEELKRDL
jgi:hypothetical protein